MTKAPATIVDWMEAHKHKQGAEAFVISEPSKTWIDRMWHAGLAMEDDATTADYEQLDELFTAYLETLEEDEQQLAAGAHVFLMDMIDAGWDDWPRCKTCSARLCPHCGERYRQQKGLEH